MYCLPCIPGKTQVAAGKGECDDCLLGQYQRYTEYPIMHTMSEMGGFPLYQLGVGCEIYMNVTRELRYTV